MSRTFNNRFFDKKKGQDIEKYDTSMLMADVRKKRESNVCLRCTLVSYGEDICAPCTAEILKGDLKRTLMKARVQEALLHAENKEKL